MKQPSPQPGSYPIGEWTFHPARNELVRGGERRQLEDRAARTLDYLFRKNGEPASKDELIAAVWDGRSLSEHTVAVVISDLRKALDDDVKNPRYIQTVAKRGYRLLVQQAPAASAVPPAAPESRGTGRIARLFGIAALVAAATAIAGLALPASGREATIITINNIRNETGEARFDPVAAAANEFSAGFIADADGSLLVRDFYDEPSWDPHAYIRRTFGRTARVYHLQGKVVVDGAAPYLALSLADGRDWSTVWSATLPVDDGKVAAPLEKAVGEMLAVIAESPDAGGVAAETPAPH